MSSGKVKSLAEVVAGIPSGSHIGLGGFAITRNVIAFAHELIRQQRRDLVISQCVGGLDTDLLVGAGLVRKLIYGTGSLDRFGPLGAVSRAKADRSIQLEPATSLAIAMRHLAGALGIPYIPVKSLLGSDVLAELEAADPPGAVQTSCPFTGQPVVALRALQPDVSVVHVNAADAEGNGFISGPTWDMKELAHAANRIILTTERLVDGEYTRSHADRTTILGLRVEAVVVVPRGAYPTAVYGEYDYDAEHLKAYAAANRSPAGLAGYIDRYILGTKDHREFLQKWGCADA